MMRWILIALYWAAWACVGSASAASVAIDFSQHVRPILSDKCFHCHGPDGERRQANLRLDTQTSVQERGVIVPGEAAKSELYRRITSDNPAVRMPPPKSQRTLSKEQIEILRQWIEAGAEHERHWALEKITRPDVPRVEQTSQAWARNPIDNFVIQRLRKADLQPGGQASPETLIRRLSFDLTGLPPTLEEINRFVADDSPDAYEQLVDRLLQSPHFGEQLARDWLDLARYSDTQGYQRDEYRTQWPWRDWVIRAFNGNMPFDQFVTWQLAGDLLPDATTDQILATAFCRLHPHNAEGGIVEEEFRVEYVADRTETFGSALLGMTVECARCHDHKFDPISQREFYQLFSFFNNVDEAGQITWYGPDMPAPTLLLPDQKQRRRIAAIDRQITRAENELRSYRQQQRTAFDTWLAEQTGSAGLPMSGTIGLIGHFSLDKPTNQCVANSVSQQPDGMIFDVTRGALTKRRLQSVPGKIGQAVLLNGDDALWFPGIGRWRSSEPFSVGIWVWLPPRLKSGVIFHNNVGAAIYRFKGYQLSLEDGRLDARIAHYFPYDCIHLVSDGQVPKERWTHVMLTYDGSSRASGVRLYVDGQPAECIVRRDRLRKDLVFGPEGERKDSRLKHQHLQVGARLRSRGLAGGRADELAVFERRLSPLEVAELAGRDELAQLLARLPGELSGRHEDLLFDWYLARHDAGYVEHLAELQRLRTRRADLLEPVLEVMVMDEMPESRQAYVLERGAYDAPGEPVEPGTPAAVLPFDDGLPRNRLGLARWLFLPENPLTARVAVNRYWQLIFGRGLVATAEDFGVQGQPPSHPQLLNWLAHEFMSDWDVRRMIRLMVTSATYRQSSCADAAKLRQDPDNVLLSRGPSGPLSAEQVRDNALAVSGLLVSRIGGPSVKPYQPPGLWSINSQSGKYVQGHGEDLYRRSLYTFWKQTNPPPSMMIFDAPTRSYCVLRRQQTSTPLQALVLLNDTQFVEAARVMAQRLVADYPQDPACRFETAFRMATSRMPNHTEVEVLLAAYEEQLAHFQVMPERAGRLIRTGEYPVDEGLSAPDVAATTMVTSLLLNVEENVTKR